MASGSSGGKGNGGSKRKGAQSRLTYRQMQATRGNRGRAIRRMQISRANASIPF